MNIRRIQFLMSVVFVIGYFILLGAIIFIEASDSVNMKQGENSMMGEFKILIGVMTGAVAQVMNFWFNKAERPDALPKPPVQVDQAPVAAPLSHPDPDAVPAPTQEEA